MNGERVANDSIKIFNETAISARWKHGGSATRFFLDRIAGRLEVETTEDFLEWEKNEFQCNFSQKSSTHLYEPVSAVIWSFAPPSQ